MRASHHLHFQDLAHGVAIRGHADGVGLERGDPVQVVDAVSDQALVLMNRMDDMSERQQTILLDLFSKIAQAMGKLNTKDRKVVEKFLGDIF